MPRPYMSELPSRIQGPSSQNRLRERMQQANVEAKSRDVDVRAKLKKTTCREIRKLGSEIDSFTSIPYPYETTILVSRQQRIE